jgi:hypothetical protein
MRLGRFHRRRHPGPQQQALLRKRKQEQSLQSSGRHCRHFNRTSISSN